MGLLDSAISVVSPRWARRRAADRFAARQFDTRSEAMASIAAAERNRLTKDFKDDSLSADQAIVEVTPRLLSRARAAVTNHWAAWSIVAGYRRHIVGTGITSKANARDPKTGKPFKEFNRRIDALWKRWARDSRLCDVERAKTFTEFQGLGISEFATVGQSFLIWSFTPRPDMPGLRLQLFEPEQLDWTKIEGRGGREVRGGIEIDDTGRNVAYWFHTRKHPFESFADDSIRVPAKRVFHLRRQDRARQTHGLSRLTPVLMKLHHVHNYDVNMMVRARLEACIGGVVTTDPGGTGSALGTTPPAGVSDIDSSGNRRVIMEPGMMPVMNPGEEVVFNTPTGVGGAYEPFMRQQLVEIAAGAGSDYPTMARDFRFGTFSNQRQGKLEQNDETDPLQLMEINIWCRPVRELFTTFAILQGLAEAPGFFSDPELTAAYLEAIHKGPPKPWINPQQQATAARIMITDRMGTRRDVLNELGGEVGVDDVLEQTADELRRADELGVRLPEQPNGLTTNQTSASPANQQPGDDEDSDPGQDVDNASEPVKPNASRMALHRQPVGLIQVGNNGHGGRS